MKKSCSNGPARCRSGRRGHAMVEVALLAPWIFFLFVGVLDVGFYCYSLITAANAARLAVLTTSSSESTSADSVLACALAMNEMQSLPNVYGQSACAPGAVSKAKPVSATADCIDNTKGGACTSGNCLIPTEDCEASVTINYLTVPLVPIPGILPMQMTIVKTAYAKVAGS